MRITALLNHIKRHRAHLLAKERSVAVLASMCRGSVKADNESILSQTLKDTGSKKIPCMAHCLNIVVMKCLSKPGDFMIAALKTARGICSHFRHSATTREGQVG